MHQLKDQVMKTTKEEQNLVEKSRHLYLHVVASGAQKRLKPKNPSAGLPAQVQSATSRLKASSIGGLFRGGSSGAADVAKAGGAPEALSTCTGNWLSHLDFDGER